MGKLYTYDGTQWIEVVGTTGPAGDDGKEVELQATDTYVQWRYEGESWTNLIALSEITGANGTNGTNGTDGSDGQEIELQVTGTHIQWRYAGESWTNLIALSELIGPAGNDGLSVPSGGTSGQTLLKNSSTDYDYSWATPPSAPVTSVNTETGDVVLTQDDVGDGTTYKQYSGTEKSKLSGIASGATANSADATLLARANHTGTQTASTISDFSTAADARITSAIGSTVQAYDADLTTWGGKTAPSGTVVGTSDSQVLTSKSLTSPYLSGQIRTESAALSSNTTLTTSSASIQFVTASSADITLTLPSTTTAGYTYTIKKMDSTAYKIIISGTFDGTSGGRRLYSKGDSITVQSTTSSGSWNILQKTTKRWPAKRGWSNYAK